jgi:hypothetical protein
LLIAVSFSGVDLQDYRMPVPAGGEYEVVFFSGPVWPGEGVLSTNTSEEGSALHFSLPARSAVILSRCKRGVSITVGG